MNLPKEALDEFRQIYLQEYGKELSDSETERTSSMILELISVLTTDKERELK